MLRRVAVALCLIAVSVPLCAQSPSPIEAPTVKQAPPLTQIKDLHIPRITNKPLLEEFLNGASRKDMQRVDDFRQRNPGDGIAVSRKTSAWVAYDDKNLYAVFVCEAPPGQTRARMAKREDIFSDDFVALFLDTYQDHQRAYEFFVNPVGVQADGVETDGANDDYSFDTLWYSEGRLTPEGFVAMMSIPFKSLRFSTQDMQLWGFGLGRFIPTNNEASFWPYITQKVNGFSSQLGTANGLENISPGRNLQFIPYAAFGHAHFLDSPAVGAPSFRTNNDHRAGLEAKAVIHDSLSLDVALNPDFSQVESDDPQVTVNQRYAVQFPEKRSFFIENNGFFATPETLFFSRQVIDPEYGARLTGKLGRWNLGILAVDDRAAGLSLATTDPHYGGHALIGVVRAQREFAKQSSVGVMFTDREFAGYHNRVAAIDTRLQLNSIWVLRTQGMTSQTVDTLSSASAAGHSGGDAWNGSLTGQTRKFYSNFQYIDRSEGFRADLGFIQRVNVRQAQEFFQRRYHPKSKVLLSFGPQMYLQADADHHGVQTDWIVRPGFQAELARNTFLGINHAEIFERFGGINFRRTDNGFGGHTEYFRKATLDWGYSWGKRIDYNTPTGLNAFLGTGRELQANLTFRPVSRLKWDEIYYYTELRTNSETVFVNHLIRSRFNYQFTRALSLRTIMDYNATLQNPLLITLDRQKRITGDVLLTYLIHPGTAFYLGYTDSLENLALLPGNPFTTARIGFPSTTTQRQFFAKISYLFRF
jgi:hypothetical protein